MTASTGRRAALLLTQAAVLLLLAAGPLLRYSAGRSGGGQASLQPAAPTSSSALAVEGMSWSRHLHQLGLAAFASTGSTMQQGATGRNTGVGVVGGVQQSEPSISPVITLKDLGLDSGGVKGADGSGGGAGGGGGGGGGGRKLLRGLEQQPAAEGGSSCGRAAVRALLQQQRSPAPPPAVLPKPPALSLNDLMASLTPPQPGGMKLSQLTQPFGIDLGALGDIVLPPFPTMPNGSAPQPLVSVNVNVQPSVGSSGPQGSGSRSGTPNGTLRIQDLFPPAPQPGQGNGPPSNKG